MFILDFSRYIGIDTNVLNILFKATLELYQHSLFRHIVVLWTEGAKVLRISRGNVDMSLKNASEQYALLRTQSYANAMQMASKLASFFEPNSLKRTLVNLL